MRIKQIEINGLFDMFNHAIKLNQDKRLTIVYGENGIGKTMIFKLLDIFFHLRNSKISILFDAPFESINIYFIDNSKFTISKKEDAIEIAYSYNLIKNKTFNLSTQLDKEYETTFRKVVKIIEKKTNFSHLDAEDFEYNDDVYSLQEILEKHPEIVSNPILEKLNSIPKDLKKIIEEIHLYFIHTQRLFTNQYDTESDDEKIVKETVIVYSEEMAELIANKNDKYRKLSEELKSSLSNRILTKKINPDISIIELQKLIKTLEQKRNIYKEVGLIEDRNESFEITNDINELERAILSVNIQDMLKQLEIYEEENFYERLALFIEILNNRRLSYKRINISEKHGFTFTNDKGKELKPENLSSGEQHELVLLYQLLFKIPENSLILIDEPEISLHITWQKEFTNDMEDIIKLRNFDVLLATHSPAIINGNWEITQSLNGYEETE